MATEQKQIRIRRDTTARWTQYNPVLASGEFGVDIDTGDVRFGFAGDQHYLDLPVLARIDADTRLPEESIMAALDARYSSGVRPEVFGAVADYNHTTGTGTDNTDALNAAANAVAALGAGVIQYTPGGQYGAKGTVLLPSNIVVDLNGGTHNKMAGGTSTSFVNAVAEGAVGYGSGAKNITIQNGRIRGNYDAGVVVDGSTGWNHVDNLNFINVKFEELQQNAHAMDLGGCRNVKVIGCTFAGLKTVSGREYVEAIQVDSSSYIGSSWKSWPTSSYDGLPTRGVLVQGCTFTTYTKGSTTYPMPCPIGQHGAFGQDATGYYESVRFIGNQVIGYNTPVPGTAYGWLHFRSARNIIIHDNQFEYTGPTGVTGKPTVISVLSTTSAYAMSDAGNPDASASSFTPPLNPSNISVTDNEFKGFQNAPTEAGSALINIVGAATSKVAGNTCDGLSSSFVTNPAPSGGNTNVGLTVQGNTITSQSTEPVILITSGVLVQVKDNTLTLPNNGIGVQMDTCNASLVQGNILYLGATGVLIRGCSNTSVQDNLSVSQTDAGISVGPAGFGTSASDTVLMGNRTRATATGAAGIKLGSTSNRTKMQANTLLSTVPLSQSGDTNTTTPVPNITAA